MKNPTMAIVTPRADGTVDLTLKARKMWQIKHVTAANEQLGKRYAERRCAARLLPDLPLKEAVRRITGAD
ncbi:hypothetical protein ABIA68_001297 [Stenotrophomonas rhizophila]|uniref:hypothetical protein n=1 Tax=Stenotrophomonas rhizophila TaxID=216778 RepID=UPI0033963272